MLAHLLTIAVGLLGVDDANGGVGVLSGPLDALRRANDGGVAKSVVVVVVTRVIIAFFDQSLHSRARLCLRSQLREYPGRRRSGWR